MTNIIGFMSGNQGQQNNPTQSPYAPAYARTSNAPSNPQVASNQNIAFPSVPTTNPQSYAQHSNSAQVPAYASVSRPSDTNVNYSNIPCYVSGLPELNLRQANRDTPLPLYISQQDSTVPNQLSSNNNASSGSQQSSYSVPPNNSASSVPSAYSNPPVNNPKADTYMPSYASVSTNNNAPVAPCTGYSANPPVSQPSNNIPASYGSEFQSDVKKEEPQLYGSDLQKLYGSVGQQTSYMSLAPRAPVAVAADSLRQSFGQEVQAKTNEDGSTEGWLWQQRGMGTWDRLYFILDDNQLLGFKHYPQKAEEASPIQGLQLKTGMLVTSKFASYCGVRGCCFSIQVQPKSCDVVVFDTVNDADRSVWVAALEKATKANELNAWVPWEVESKTAQLEKEQEMKQLQQIEEERMEREKEQIIQKHLEEIQQQEIAKVGDAQLAVQLKHSYSNQKEIETLEKQLDKA